MCVVSMIGDHYRDRLPVTHPWVVPMTPTPVRPNGWPWVDEPQDNKTRTVTHPTREEFEALKRDVEEMKELLKRAKDYDARNNEPDCEVEDKMVLLRKIAELVGVDIDDVIGKPTTTGEH